MPYLMVGTNNCKIYINVDSIGLEIDQVCAKVFLSIVPMDMYLLEVGGYYSSRYHKTFRMNYPWIVLIKNLF